MSEMLREPKVGDVVHVRMTIARVHPHGRFNGIDRDGDGVPNILVADIVHIEPAPLRVGDRVFGPSMTKAGTIKCIDDDQVAIRWDDGSRGWWHLSDLTRISDGAAS